MDYYACVLSRLLCVGGFSLLTALLNRALKLDAELFAEGRNMGANMHALNLI